MHTCTLTVITHSNRIYIRYSCLFSLDFWFLLINSRDWEKSNLLWEKMEVDLPNASTIIALLTIMFLNRFLGFYNPHSISNIFSMLESLSNITVLLCVVQEPRIPTNERNPGCTMMAARRKEIKHNVKTEPHRLSRVPIRLFHS